MSINDYKQRAYEAYLAERRIIINEGIKDNLIERVVLPIIKFNELDEMKEKSQVGYKRKPIKIYVNSYGGSAYDVASLVSTIMKSKTPIYTYCLGKAMSAGFMIVVAGHKRYAQSLSTLMWHQIANGRTGDLEALSRNVQEMERLQTIFDNVIIQRTNVTKEQLAEMRDRRLDWYMSPEEALELGVVHKIL